MQDYLLNTEELEVEEGHRVVQDFLGVVLDIKVELQVSLTPSQDFGKQKY